MEEILSVVREELNISDATLDNKLKRLINRSCIRISNYLNTKLKTIDIINNYPDAVIELTCNTYNISQSESSGVKSIKEGDVSITYSDDKDIAFTKSVKDLLPLPFVGMW